MTDRQTADLRAPRDAPLDSMAEPRPEDSSAILLVGFERRQLDQLRELIRARLGGDTEVLAAADRDEAFELLARRQMAVVCLGERCAGEEARRLIADEPRDALASPRLPVHLVLAAGPEPELFQDLIAEDRIFYLTKSPPPLSELAALLDNALSASARAAEAAPAPPDPATADRIDIADLLRRLALLPEPAEKAELLGEAARDVARSQRAYCLLHDPSDDTLWSRDPASNAERRESAAVGLASFALRSGIAFAVPRAGRDPRYDREADDPRGDGSERLAAVPLAGPDGRATVVLVAVRLAREAEFSRDDIAALERLDVAMPYLLPPPAPYDKEGDELFRREALEQYQRPNEQQDPLMISPAWTSWAYRILLLSLVASLLFSIFGKVNEYASGVAVVQMAGRDDITATDAGTVAAVEVAAGQRVAPGQPLFRLYDAQEAAELARTNQEFELQLIKRLRDPSDAGAEQALISLTAQRQLARAKVGERIQRAPRAGVVSDLRLRPGQYLTPGQAVLSVVQDTVQPSVLVLLPGEYRPQLRKGMPIRFEISGYRYAYQKLALGAVDDEVVGPTEARRFVGPEIGDALQIEGPVVIVRARLPRATFTAEGKTYRYHNGMHGTAEIQVRSERILVMLVPGLRAVFGDS